LRKGILQNKLEVSGIGNSCKSGKSEKRGKKESRKSEEREKRTAIPAGGR
jgi:hypothetical protein